MSQEIPRNLKELSEAELVREINNSEEGPHSGAGIRREVLGAELAERFYIPRERYYQMVEGLNNGDHRWE